MKLNSARARKVQSELIPPVWTRSALGAISPGSNVSRLNLPDDMEEKVATSPMGAV